ncbi:MAG: DEAD/DEAH box helicase family protein [Promethearchaeota archaeon]
MGRKKKPEKETRIFLRDMVENIDFKELPDNWRSFNFKTFSKTKQLWSYQQSALKNALITLFKFYEDFGDFRSNENLKANMMRKKRFYDWYKMNGLDEEIDIKLDGMKREFYEILIDYYPFLKNRISYENFINRMGFWMATGSGKTLVIVKLIYILIILIKRKEIPPCDILFLTHREDLIVQFKEFLNEFNEFQYFKNNSIKLDLRDLKEYPEIKRQNKSSMTIFYYRSDNISDSQKEKIIDFRSYDNNGMWYIFLDEAHKGDKEDSKRQHIYSILSRNGFLFNFSATFTDPRDIITCVFEFNLSSFINAGYGKHICILKQEIRQFKKKEDYNEDEKQKIVLKSLIIFTYIKKFFELISKTQENLYHKPLMLVLVNSVNTEDADLKLFFKELEKIGKGLVKPIIFKSAIKELWNELKDQTSFIFEDNSKLLLEEDIFKNLEFDDVLNYSFNSETAGGIEILRSNNNTKEIAFKLKTSSRPFALIKIGDISNWLKIELKDYEIQEKFEDAKFFENLNKEYSDINILMGSRGFYEGWDSNRPNVINFINIGIGKNTKKFVLQSTGRGLRIEPVKNVRKRLQRAFEEDEINSSLYESIKNKVLPLETLFIFGTKRSAIVKVIQELKKEKSKLNYSPDHFQKEIKLNQREEKLNAILEEKGLIIGKDFYLSKNNGEIKFNISKEELNYLKNYLDFIDDDRILLMKYDTTPKKIFNLRKNINNSDNAFNVTGKRSRDLDLLIQKYFDFLDIVAFYKGAQKI